ncbi:hypothetical protein DCC39_15990 [Pueribacillus theae]|uniref:Uncharacterized protein n=1 Tax=Pueribacillus theae TaxID=2171751 RepID=A0A2U1JRW0_9BACI|nr:hypothetical protein [Pueribacillus theae]PWA07901.1 hypothetical protein DCC39_15990 [Pueribacillus theae]
MNYNEFMRAVDKKLSTMSEMEKTEWIHNLARTKKEHERISFLNSLDEKQGYPAIADRKWIEDWCNKVENEEIYFECRGYEEYGESYWDSDYIYDYYDSFEIGKDLSTAFQVAEDLLFQKDYKQASELYDRLCRMTFNVLDTDTEEWDELGLEDIVEKELVDLDLKQIALHLMYTKYQVTEGEERTAALYQYLTWNMCENINVEEMLTVGPEELEGIGFFMEEWISFLKNTEGDRAGKLLLEACIFQGGISRLCETAREVSARHPVLYKYACEYLINDNKEPECEKIGLEAIRVLPENLMIRAEIAELTAMAAEQLEHPDIIKECYEAAFYADSTVNNYLRLFELPDYQNIVDKAAKYAKTLPENSIRGLNHNMKQMTVNHLSMEHKKIIRFFNGEFDYVYEACKNDKTTLGWSSCFKGIAIPLFILFLDKNKKITKAGQQLINGIAYRLGFIEEDDMESFLDLFLNWKEKVVLANEQYEKYIEWIKKEVDQRTEAVVGGGYRKSYYKAAALIAALGETLESNGKMNGKMVTIEHYKKLHSRKRAFKAEIEML